MQSVLVDASVVAIAHDVNLSIFRPPWLVKSRIFTEKELQGEIVVTPAFVQVPTDNFQLMVFPDRIQMAIRLNCPDAADCIQRVMGGVVSTLPHTPYTAAGLNFKYLAAPESADAFAPWNRALLSSSFADEVAPPDDGGARFGSYVSFDTLGLRLKLDIKPTKAPDAAVKMCKSWRPGQDLVSLGFNFHADVTQAKEPADELIGVLGKWTDALALSEKIAGQITD